MVSTTDERTRQCSVCRLPKSWDCFSVRKLWPDGSVRQVQSRCRDCNRAYQKNWRADPREPSQRLSAFPFDAWLRSIMARDDALMRPTADRLGIAEGTMRRLVVGTQARVDLLTVERALIADDTITLRELYPDLYLEAA